MDLNKSEINCHWVDDKVRHAIAPQKRGKNLPATKEKRISFMRFPFQVTHVN